MSSNIFCPNCGTTIVNNSSSCNCGYVVSFSEKNEIAQRLREVDALIFIENESMEMATYAHNELDKYKLSRTYLISSSAKEDYELKAKFIQKELIPSINYWREVIQAAEQRLAKDKVEVFGRIIKITDFVLKEFYGPFNINENGLLEFIEYQDFSRYELFETMIEANLDFSDIETTNFGDIGNNILSSVESTLKTGSFNELKNKSEWSSKDVKRVKTELGVAIAAELIAGMANLIGQNMEAIKSVREADKQLNGKIKTVSNVINALKIEQEELKKFKKLFDKSDVILDQCFNKILKPIVEELNQDELYIEYKTARAPYDLQQQKINLDDQALQINTKVSFWDCLIRTSASNFKKHWTKRMSTSGNLELYQDINVKLNEKQHRTLEDLTNYKSGKTIEFENFENKYRPQLKTRPAIRNNAAAVKSFIQVLRNVKKNIIPKELWEKKTKSQSTKIN